MAAERALKPGTVRTLAANSVPDRHWNSGRGSLHSRAAAPPSVRATSLPGPGLTSHTSRLDPMWQKKKKTSITAKISSRRQQATIQASRKSRLRRAGQGITTRCRTPILKRRWPSAKRSLLSPRLPNLQQVRQDCLHLSE